MRYCDSVDDCVPVGCTCRCSGCGGFSSEDIINKKYEELWYRKNNCTKPFQCPTVCCFPAKTIVCLDNTCSAIRTPNDPNSVGILESNLTHTINTSQQEPISFKYYNLAEQGLNINIALTNCTPHEQETCKGEIKNIYSEKKYLKPQSAETYVLEVNPTCIKDDEERRIKKGGLFCELVAFSCENTNDEESHSNCNHFQIEKKALSKRNFYLFLRT